nr:DUF4123 domain-containing protein [Paracoccus amoyensis]
MVDGARDPSIHIYAQAFPEIARCLYDGEVSEDLVEVAPWLIELREYGPALDWLVREGLDQDWGIYIQSKLPMPRLKARLKRILRVRDDGGKNYLFKYYRPRHLNDYLPAMLAEQLELMFSGVDAFLAEDQHQPGVMILHRPDQIAAEHFDLRSVGRSRVIRPSESYQGNHKGA